jgi:hypothetical protein
MSKALFFRTGLLVSSLLIGLTTGCSYGNNGRFARTASDDASLHPEAKQDIEKLLAASNDDATDRAVLCIHSVYEAESDPTSNSPSNINISSANAKTAAADANAKVVDPKELKFEKGDPSAKDVSSFSFSVSKDAIAREKTRACLKLCAPSPSDNASEEVRSIAKKYSDRCRTHFGELRALSAD